MQWVLGRLKGRLGVAAVLLLVILTAVGIGRALGNSDSGPPLGSGSNGDSPAAVSSPAEDDGVENGPSVRPPGPSLSPGAAEPLNVAEEFLTAWLHSTLSPERWHDELVPYATPSLADKLSGVDPAGVPAKRTTGDPQLIPRGSGAAAVSVPVDSGKVDLRMVVLDGRWLVDGVDWSRA
jgi:hypothetical protein